LLKQRPPKARASANEGLITATW